MTDKELLELAAKAAGITNWQAASRLRDAKCDSDGVPYWNPLTDDGDALRLAVKLGLDILLQPSIKSAGAEGETTVFGPFKGESWESDRFVEEHGSDPYAATRLAIVRAAAAIGKGMK